MAERKGVHIKPAEGNLGVLTVGLGAVSTTLIAGVEAVKQGWVEPIGSVTQLGRIRLGKRTDNRNPLIREFVPLTPLQNLVFGSWDIIPDTAYQQALHAEVLQRDMVDNLHPALDEVRPMPGVFDQNYVRRLRGLYVKQGKNKMELAEQVMEDIAGFKRRENCDRAVVLFAASTEASMKPGEDHQDLAHFEKALLDNSPNVSPSMIYAYAALKSGAPFINGTPGFAVDIPAMVQLARELGLPIAGKDFKTGQTLLKTALAPMFKARMLGVDGWNSYNVLGNKDGEVLRDPGSNEAKLLTKGSVLGTIFQPELYPMLYGNTEHRITIDFYGPAGDDKEAWDRIDFVGWLGRKMSMRVDFQGSDSTLAAPVALDLVLFMDLAQRAGMSGIQEWLSFYFKEPMVAQGLYAEHDLAIQQMKLKNRLRDLKGEELITHLGLEYYD